MAKLTMHCNNSDHLNCPFPARTCDCFCHQPAEPPRTPKGEKIMAGHCSHHQGRVEPGCAACEADQARKTELPRTPEPNCKNCGPGRSHCGEPDCTCQCHRIVIPDPRLAELLAAARCIDCFGHAFDPTRCRVCRLRAAVSALESA